ncbi:MAG: hypothetical protein UZ14_CFX002001909 [Chloroflexi bacterium OLB14]|nr:MAG: hypothetical protein UZ14_CFX002001909 [Chloroflexi bacterium OLB14]
MCMHLIQVAEESNQRTIFLLRAWHVSSFMGSCFVLSLIR